MFENPGTVKQLETMTDFVRFEMLYCDLLAGYGSYSYQGIVPQGVGRIDGGKDAILVVRDEDDVTVVRERVAILDEPNAPDVIAALRALLMKKCCYDAGALAQRNIVFGSETWVRSFMGMGCAEVSPNQSGIQSNYLRYALNGLRGNTAQPLSQRLRERKLELKHWNVLIHNLKLADAEFFHAELEPLLQHMPQADITGLFRDADMLNLGYFASHFALDTGEFTWRPRVNPGLNDLDFTTQNPPRDVDRDRASALQPPIPRATRMVCGSGGCSRP